MRAVIVRQHGGPEVLELADVPTPEPGPGQVRIRVAAAAVNPVDLQTRSGALTQAGLLPPRPTTGLGWDVAGTIDTLGPGVTTFAPGDRVIGLSDRLPVSLKTQADHVILDADAVAPLPPATDLAAAATLPLAALTAAQSLDQAALHPGQTLLVTGAAGAVGAYVVELAARSGIRVVALASAQDEPFLTEIGAERVISSTAQRIPQDLGSVVRGLVPGGVDAVVDAASLGMPALDAVCGGGVFVALLAGRAPVPLRGIRVANVWIRADGPRLAELAQAGLHLRVAGTLPLEDVAEAHRRLEKGGLRGRLVLIT
jgi:NADPH:quinone reductase-like Zn-dependent oxidoreductase